MVMSVAPFDLNLRHLRAFVAAVAQGSISAAADTVSLSQPALTQGITKLERQLKTQLLHRQSDGIVALDAGLLVAGRATAALDHLAEAMRGKARGRGFARPELLMTAAQMRAFLALADAGSFVGAAQATGLSQPALHRAVRDLEQICATALAERRGRGVALTATGRRLARGARLARNEIAAAIAELATEPGADRLVIGAMPLCRAFALPTALARYVRGSPRALIDVVEGSWRELVEPLRDGQLDMMIGALRPEAPPGLEQRALFADRLVVIGRADHPLARHPAPSLDDLTRFEWIVGQPGTPLRTHWDAMFEGRTPPAAPIECGSVMVARGILRDTDLLTLLSPHQVAVEIRGGLLAAIGRGEEQGTRTIGVTTRSGWRPTAAQERFLDLLDEASTAPAVQELQ